mmetsp:Transcript_9249/g.11674  ORF Transcript_9249/g.11674 Transcript_9249/m.11674 type:complete len:256 (-) Transcript_9249:177-944(-)
MACDDNENLSKNDIEQWENDRKATVANPDTDVEANETTKLSTSSSTDYTGECPTANLPWLMKDPNHSAYLPELLSQFPDAKFIFSHRAPSEIVASMAKLFVCLTSVEFIPGAPGTTSKEWGIETNLRMKHYCDGLVDFTKSSDVSDPLRLNKVGKEVVSSSSGRSSSGNDNTRRIDFYFKNVVQDIPGTICNIYNTFYPDKTSPSQKAMEAFAAYLEKNDRQKHGNQKRSLEDFHLTCEDVAFHEYHELFLNDFR